MYYKIIWVNSLHIGHFDLFVSWFLSQSFWEILRSKNYFRFICNAKISFTCIFPGWAKGFAVICAIKMWCLPKYIKYIKMWYLPEYIVLIMMLSIQWTYTYICICPAHMIYVLYMWYLVSYLWDTYVWYPRVTDIQLYIQLYILPLLLLLSLASVPQIQIQKISGTVLLEGAIVTELGPQPSQESTQALRTQINCIKTETKQKLQRQMDKKKRNKCIAMSELNFQ